MRDIENGCGFYLRLVNSFGFGDRWKRLAQFSSSTVPLISIFVPGRLTMLSRYLIRSTIKLASDEIPGIFQCYIDLMLKF